MPEKNVEHWTRVNADFTDAEARRAWAEHEFSWGMWARPDAELGILGDFPLVQAFAEDVPLPDASFDLAHSEYGTSLFADPYRWIPEAHRLLRPGGRLVFIRGGPLVILCAGEDGITEQFQRPLRGLNRFDQPAESDQFWAPARRAVRAPAQNRVRCRGPRRALRAGRRPAARVLLLRHPRVGTKMARRRDMGGAEGHLRSRAAGS